MKIIVLMVAALTAAGVIYALATRFARRGGLPSTGRVASARRAIRRRGHRLADRAWPMWQDGRRRRLLTIAAAVAAAVMCLFVFHSVWLLLLAAAGGFAFTRAGRRLISRARDRVSRRGEPAAPASVQRETVAPPPARDTDFAQPMASGPPLTEQQIAAGAPVPPDHAAVCARVAGFEPEDDQALMMHLRGESAGRQAYAEAFRALAEGLLANIGLDPAFTGAVAELADNDADSAHDFALLTRQFITVYRSLLDHLDAGRTLPYHAREFMTGDFDAA